MWVTDGSGAIDLKEFAKIMEELCEPMPEAELRKAFDELDTDHSGEIDVFEFQVRACVWQSVVEGAWLCG